MFYFIATKKYDKQNRALLKETNGRSNTRIKDNLMRDVDYVVFTPEEWAQIKGEYDIEIKMDKIYHCTIELRGFTEICLNNIRKDELTTDINNNTSQTNGAEQVLSKTIVIYGIETVYEAVLKVFMNPSTKMDKFNREYKVELGQTEIDIKSRFDDLAANYGNFEGDRCILIVHKRSNTTNTMVVNTNAVTGIPNLGNTCFMNSSIQCLLNCDELNTAILKTKPNENRYKKVVEEYKQVVRDHCSRDSGLLCVASLKREVGRLNPTFSGFDEQDAPEFIIALLSMLHDGTLCDKTVDVERVLDTSEYDSALSGIFSCKHSIRIRCSKCGVVSNKQEISTLLSLPIPNETVQIVLSIRDAFRIIRSDTVADAKEMARKIVGDDETGDDVIYVVTFYRNNSFNSIVQGNRLNKNSGGYYILYKLVNSSANVLCKTYYRTMLWLVYSKMSFDFMVKIETKKYSVNEFKDAIVAGLYKECAGLLLPGVTLSKFGTHVTVELANDISNTVIDRKIASCEVYFVRLAEIFGNNLKLNDAIHVEDCVAEYLKEGPINFSHQAKGESDGCQGECSISTAIESTPPYMFITLKRFTSTGTKINTFVDFRERLLINGVAYELVGVVCHFKIGIFYGHYVSYVKKGDSWYCCNDSVVSRGKVEKKTAYVFLYRRV
ncbi:UBP15 [Enterospora canceri]|uniref:UBP15 n=1 Tax=Enterospora canceri TaxID=1081671 RepID=A0A1Y1S7E3_9MICR|nr:UBP15 [Enterospora canceri]